jgi:short-subunit dehydrogenase
MLSRTKKSAIVFISSICAEKPLSGILTYSSSKAYASQLAMCLNYELKGKIDVTVYEPGMVLTKLIVGKSGGGKITTE